MYPSIELSDIYKTIVDNSFEHYLVCLPDGKIVFVNKSVEKHLGYTTQLLDDVTIYDLLLDNDKPKTKLLIDLATEQPSKKEALFFISSTNKQVILHMQVFCKGGLVYLFGNERRENQLSLQRKYKAEMEKAKRIYQRSLPDSLPVADSISFAAYYQPAEELGGDIYDVFKVDNGMLDDFFEQYVVLLCDVTGHGLDSAMLSLFAKETINQYFQHKHSEGQLLSPKEIVQDFIQEYLNEKYPEDYFICVFLGIFDIKNEEFSYCSAGYQNAPLITNSDGITVELPTGGLPISSALPEEIMDYPERTIPLTSGMTFLISTDGMPEQEQNGILFESRMKDVFTVTHTKSATEIVQALCDDFYRFAASEKIADDVTFIIVQTK